MRLPFVKMHGIGNDYVYLDCVRDRALEALTGRSDWRSIVSRISDRHCGVGSDGVILVCSPRDSANAVRMRMFNADGSESEMCGNGVRCVAKFAHDRLGIDAAAMRVETGAGVRTIVGELHSGKLVAATVDMGTPVFTLADVPVDAQKLESKKSENANEHTVEVGGAIWSMCFVSMGNPHAVAFVNDVDSVDLERVGPLVERHTAFPQRINFHVGQTIGDRNRKAKAGRMRTWERGSGITQACGTGACAVFAAGVVTGRFDLAEKVSLQLPGGTLRLAATDRAGDRWRISMTGPAEDICEGVWLGEI